jgi:hypothetical protein
MERSIEFNNAGVKCIEAGHHKVAWDLFKGALEVKLSFERNDMQSNDDGSRCISSRSNSYIQKAEAHLLTMDAYLTRDTCVPITGRASEASSSMLDASEASSSMLDRNPRLEPLEAGLSSDSLYAPFLFSHPMELRLNPDISTRRQSATIIFNLALVDHMKNRCSEQAVQLYELAMTLLTGDAVDTLGIALMNNIGVWCYENGDMDGALACMRHIASFIGSCGSYIDQEQKDGLQSNILWLMNPPFAASPAA